MNKRLTPGEQSAAQVLVNEPKMVKAKGPEEFREPGIVKEERGA